MNQLSINIRNTSTTEPHIQASHGPLAPSATIFNTTADPSPSRSSSSSTLEPTQIALDKLDSLRPVGLVFKDRLVAKMKLFKHKCIYNSISPTGRLVGWFGEERFSIYEIAERNVSLFCTGMLQKGEYRYGRTDKPNLKQFHKHDTQNITCAALSEEYIAIGTNETLLIMALQTDPPGKWLCIAKHGDIENLAFSPSGDQLLVLSRTKHRSHKAIMHSTSEFSHDHRLSDNKPKPIDGVEIAEWEHSACEVLDIVFASDGNMAAICTSHDPLGRCRIRLLKKYSRGWRKYGDQLIRVKQRKDATRGICNIALYLSPLPFC